MKIKSYRKNNSEDWDNFKEKLDHIKFMVDSRYLIESLGFSIERESSKELRATCIIHGGDNTTAFRFNKETKTWVCFTHKCHEVHGNDVIGLIKAVLGLDFIGAVNYLKSIVGDIDDSVDYVEIKRKREMDDFINSYNDGISVPKNVSEDSLKSFKRLRSNYFLNHGFLKETLDYFEISGGWKDKYGFIRDIIPIRDDDCNLVAYSLRDIREDVYNEDDKYLLTPGFNKQNCLYNLHNAQRYSNGLPLIVVEGFKSVWRLYEYGIYNVVSSMGSKITEGQQYLLYTYAINGVVVMFDNDIPGINGTLSACKDLAGKIEVMPVFIQEIDDKGKGLDPADLTDVQIYEYLDTYFISKHLTNTK